MTDPTDTQGPSIQVVAVDVGFHGDRGVCGGVDGEEEGWTSDVSPASSSRCVSPRGYGSTPCETTEGRTTPGTAWASPEDGYGVQEGLLGGLAGVEASKRLLSRRELALGVCIGQGLSVVVTSTSVVSQGLAVWYDLSMPATQAFLGYLLLSVCYTGMLAWEGRLWGLLRSKLWKYAILGVIDVEANYVIVLAFRYTSIVSVMLLDCFTIPVVMLLAYLFLGTRYQWLHVGGVMVCMAGMAMLVVADLRRHQEGDAPNPLLGDMLALGAAVLYAISNVAQEAIVKQYSRVEFLGMLSLCALPISAIQMLVLERHALHTFPITWGPVGLMLGFGVFQFAFYSLVPILIARTSAAFLNLSLLTSDIYGLVAGIVLFHLDPGLLFLAAFAVIMVGILLYHRHPPLSPLDDDDPGHPIVVSLSEDADTMALLPSSF